MDIGRQGHLGDSQDDQNHDRGRNQRDSNTGQGLGEQPESERARAKSEGGKGQTQELGIHGFSTQRFSGRPGKRAARTEQ